MDNEEKKITLIYN